MTRQRKEGKEFKEHPNCEREGKCQQFKINFFKLIISSGIDSELSCEARVGLNRRAGSYSGGNNGRRRTLPKIELVDSRRRVIRLCAVIVLAFALLSLPRYIYLTWSVWREANG
uniref:Transmembrane protein n=1 Tax=Meloidogyne javanica TaxID=6303 RepID=A0A915LR59_MELJA